MALHPGFLTKPAPAVPSDTQATAQVVARVRGLGRTFDGRGVLQDITLDLRRGELVALLGRSGSGKSTLLRALARLDDGYTGRLEGPRRPAVAFQNSRLLPWKRVLDNVTLGLRGPDAVARARRMLAEVGMADHEKAWPRTLSGGEAQRVSLARALVQEPALLLMDEPFGALDALTRIRMHRLLEELTARHRPATLLVTHDVDEALLLADRVLVLDRGRLAHEDVLELPHAGRRSHPDFTGLRRSLLTALGVEDDDATTVKDLAR